MDTPNASAHANMVAKHIECYRNLWGDAAALQLVKRLLGDILHTQGSERTEIITTYGNLHN